MINTEGLFDMRRNVEGYTNVRTADTLETAMVLFYFYWS